MVIPRNPPYHVASATCFSLLGELHARLVQLKTRVRFYFLSFALAIFTHRHHLIAHKLQNFLLPRPQSLLLHPFSALLPRVNSFEPNILLHQWYSILSRYLPWTFLVGFLHKRLDPAAAKRSRSLGEGDRCKLGEMRSRDDLMQSKS